MAFSIGSVTLKHGIMLAPMAGVTDYAFRRMCIRFGAEYTVSEMVSAKAMHYRDLKTAQLARVRRDELPMAIQIFGSEPEIMAEAAEMLEKGSYRGCISEVPPSAIDINMGCPVKKIVTNGEGSALLKTPEKAFDIVRATVKATSLPVTVKIRLGWDKDSINACEVALAVEEAGCAALTVHGRTREQLYRPGVDYEAIARVKDKVKIPVIANGDITSAAIAKKVKEETACDGLMIARGAEGNPMLFAEIVAALEGRKYQGLSVNELLAMAREHISLLCEDKGEEIGVREARKHLAWYVKGIRGAAAFRNTVNNTWSLATLLRLIDELEAAQSALDEQ